MYADHIITKVIISTIINLTAIVACLAISVIASLVISMIAYLAMSKAYIAADVATAIWGKDTSD